MRQEFARSPTRVQSALRMAVGCTLALLLAFLFNWSPVSTALLPSLLLNRPNVRYDLPQTLWTAGAAAASGLFFFWTLSFSQNPLWFAWCWAGGGGVRRVDPLPTVGPAFSVGQVIFSSARANDFYAPTRPEATGSRLQSLARRLGHPAAVNSLGARLGRLAERVGTN